MKFAEIKKLSKTDKEKKLKDLRMELVKSKTGTQKTSGKSKEIRKMIAQILTLNNLKVVNNLNKLEVEDKK